MAHRAGFGSGVQYQFVAVESGAGEDQLIDGIDLPVKCWIESGFIPALGHDLAVVPIHDQCAKREIGNIRRQFDGPLHVVFVIVEHSVGPLGSSGFGDGIVLVLSDGVVLVLSLAVLVLD